MAERTVPQATGMTPRLKLITALKYGDASPSREGFLGGRENWRPAETFIAALACVAVGAQVVVLPQISVGVALPVVLAPMWWRGVRAYRGASAFFVLGVVVLSSGWVLTQYAQATHQTSAGDLIRYSLLAVSLFTTIGVLLWARLLLRRAMPLWFALGLIVHAGLAPATPNLWKYTLSVPIVILALGAAGRRPSRSLEVLLLVILTAVSAVSDSRSLASMLAMAMALVCWQAARSWLRLRSTALRTIITIGLLGVSMYALMQALILDGYLGEAAKERSVQQIATSGTLIAGGRPELGAAWALISHQIWGYGSGTRPSFADILVAKTGMSELNYNPNNGYVDNYLFGDGYEVHSVLGDLWIHFGVAGAILLVVLVAGVVYLTAQRIASGTATALILFLAVRVAWDMFFSPFYVESIAVLGLSVAMALNSRASPGPVGGSAAVKRAIPSRNAGAPPGTPLPAVEIHQPING